MVSKQSRVILSPLVYLKADKKKSVKGRRKPVYLPLILFFIGYNSAGGRKEQPFTFGL